jgi:hypothetical protein
LQGKSTLANLGEMVEEVEMAAALELTADALFIAKGKLTG